jgi:hypothetical protein
MKRQMTTTKTTIIEDGDKPMDYVNIEIDKDEWLNYPKEKRERIKELLMDQFGYDLSLLDEAAQELKEAHEESVADKIYRQFYGDEE